MICCMVIWMSANDRDIIRLYEFLHFYRLQKFKDPGYWEIKPWGNSSRLVLDSPSSLRNWKANFFFVSSDGWEFIPSEGLDDAPKLLVIGELLCLVRHSVYFIHTHLIL